MDITLNKFLTTIFPDVPDDQKICLAIRREPTENMPDGWWDHYPYEDGVPFGVGEAPWYFALATTNGATNEQGNKLKRRLQDMVMMHALVLDDIGTKADEPDLEPDWILESSEGNYQYGYMIEPLDVTDEANAQYYDDCIEALAEAGLTDGGIKGCNRVMRVPGSLHKTGFVGRITHWDPQERVTLRELMEDFGIEVKRKRARRRVQRDTMDPDQAAALLQADPVFQRLLAAGRVRGTHGEKAHIVCFGDHEEGSPSSTTYFAGGGFKCLHETCEGRGRSWLLEQLDGDDPRAPDDDDDDPEREILLQNPTEDGVAVYATRQLGDDYRFCHDTKQWLRWDGARWAPDAVASLRERVRGFARRHNERGTVTLAKSGFVSGVMRHMESHPDHARLYADFDTDHYMLNTPGGVVDLRDGVLRAADPELCISKITRATPDGAGGEVFRGFLDEITDGDTDLQHFHQVSLGACLSGAVEAHWLLFWIGEGRNGKNTLGDLVQDLLGDYGGSIPASALMSKKFADHPTEIMELKGRRLVTSSEIEEGAYWNEPRLNQVTGDGKLKGRYMHRDFIEFSRTHKHLIYGNHEPQLRNVSPALQARMKIVPFEVSFAGREDYTLPDQLWAERDYVLHWLVEGHRMWLENGRRLPHCEAVDGRTQQYFKEQSPLDLWLEEACVTDSPMQPTQLPPSSELFKKFSDWCADRKEYQMTMRRFGELMNKRFEKVMSNGSMKYRGVALKTQMTGPTGIVPQVGGDQKVDDTEDE